MVKGTPGERVASRESTEDEMRQDGIEKPKGIYCKRYGYYDRDWDEFFQHHRTKHPWIDPEVLKAALNFFSAMFFTLGS